jgi:hypothetical protein
MTINLHTLAVGLKKMLSVQPQVPSLAGGRPQPPLTAQVDELVRRKRQARPRA